MNAVYGLSLQTGAGFGRVVQIAWHTPDIPAAAERFAAEMGAGPFYLFEHIKLEKSCYRGIAAEFDHSSAYGQLGGVMIELIHQHDDRSSAVRDMYGRGEEGVHHIAVFVDSIDAAIRKANAQGLATALDATTADGVRFVMVDDRRNSGVMLEFYEPVAALKKFYEFVQRKSVGWDRRDVLRRI